MALAVVMAGEVHVQASTLAEMLLASYDTVTNLQCEIRKEIAAGDAKVKRLSRVYFSRPDRLHVDGVAPVRRRIVADGKQLCSYIDGDPMGYRKPIDQLDEDWVISLRQVPGTPMDHLLRLRGVPEEVLAAEERFPVRRGYQVGALYAVLSQDSSGRLARIEFFRKVGEGETTASYTYEHFEEKAPGAWIPMVQRARIQQGVQSSEEVTRLTNCRVNEPIPEGLFDPGAFFPGVRWTDSLGEIYPDTQ